MRPLERLLIQSTCCLCEDKGGHVEKHQERPHTEGQQGIEASKRQPRARPGQRAQEMHESAHSSQPPELREEM